MAQRILLIEDDASILRGLELNLQLEGYDVLTASDGQTGLELARAQRVDLIVLDIMLPRLNGYQVVQRLRQHAVDAPVILLSAKNAEVDKIMGLDLGADDYVTKPFSVGELLARVKAHLRRHSPSTLKRFGEVEVDLAAELVRRGGELVPLTQKEFELLKLLIEREGRALTRDTILETVWGQGYFGTDRTVDNFINRLRVKLDVAGEPLYFLTVRGVGYRFVSEPGESA